LAIKNEEIDAVSWVAELYVVAIRGVVPQYRTDPEVKFVPVMVRVNAELP
jgi:hypothetical protein